MRKFSLALVAALLAVGCTGPADRALPRAKASAALEDGFQTLIDTVNATANLEWQKMVNLHSIMVVKDGKVVEEQYFRDWTADRPHAMFSVSKTFTATAVGLAIDEGLLSLTDKVADFFPDKVRADNPCNATVEDLLMMAGGHDADLTMQVLEINPETGEGQIREGADIQDVFFSQPFVREPGTYFWYNSLGSYILSAIVTKVTGESVLDYLTPRLFEPLGIAKPYWEADKYGISAGGWGLRLTTEQMARMGLLLLQKGKWGRKQLVPREWIEQMGRKHIDCAPSGIKIEDCEARLGFPDAENDWRQGYGYQVWMNTAGGFRADGAGGQYILVLPEKNAVIIVTSWTGNLQRELNFIWEYICSNL